MATTTGMAGLLAFAPWSGALAAGGDETPPRAASPIADLERTTPPAVVEEAAPPRSSEDPTSFTSVIEMDAHAGESERIEDLLQTVPGVYVRRFGGPGQPVEVSIRGSTGAQVVVLLDGVRINSAQTGSADLSTIPAALVERIEVSRGGGSLQRGSGGIGGVVNIVTRRAGAKQETTVGAAAGSFETWQASITQTARLGESELMLGYDYFKTSGDWKFEPISGLVPDEDDEIERINNRSEQHSGLLKLARDLDEHTRIELIDDLFYSSQGSPGLDLAAGGEQRGQRERAHLRRTRNVAQLRLEGVEWSAADLGLEGIDLLLGADICFWENMTRPLINLIKRAQRAGVKEILISDPVRSPFEELCEHFSNNGRGEVLDWTASEPREILGQILKIS